MMVDCFSRLLFPKLIPLFFQGAGWFQLFQLLMTFLVSEKVECICLCFFLVTGHVHFVHEKREWSRAGFFWMLWVFQVLGTLICWLDFLNELIYFNWRLITHVWFLPYIHLNQLWVYMCPPSRTPLPAPALSVLSFMHRTWTGHLFISHVVIDMFQRYSLKSSHPCLLPQSPKVCWLYQCLFCCLTYRVIITIFLNPYICLNILYSCFSFFLTYFTLYNRLQFHPPR